MKYQKIVLLSLLLAVRVGIATAQTQKDSTSVSNDSITWNKELEGVVIKAQKQLIKQEIDRIAYDVQSDEESKTQTVIDMLRKVPMVTVDGQDNILVKGINDDYPHRLSQKSITYPRNPKPRFFVL